jgi:hypothetical protein
MSGREVFVSRILHYLTRPFYSVKGNSREAQRQFVMSDAARESSITIIEALSIHLETSEMRLGLVRVSRRSAVPLLSFRFPDVSLLFKRLCPGQRGLSSGGVIGALV